MPSTLLFADRVKDTTTTTGTGNITLAGSPPTGYQSFNSAFGTSTYFYYVIEGGAEWEVGKGHLSASTTLVRDIVTASSNSNNAVNFSAGTKNVFCSLSAHYMKDECIFKTVGEDRTSTTTVSSDSVLQYAMKANRFYKFELFAAVYSSSATPGLKYSIVAPTHTSVMGWDQTASSGGTITRSLVTSNSLPTNVTTLNPNSALGAFYKLTGSIMPTADGTFAWQFAQSTSNGTAVSTTLASYLHVIERYA